jgi:hypothetical protein
LQQVITGSYVNKNCSFLRNTTAKSFHDFDKNISWSTPGFLNLDLAALMGKQEFRRTDFGSRLLAAEGEGGEEQRG